MPCLLGRIVAGRADATTTTPLLLFSKQIVGLVLEAISRSWRTAEYNPISFWWQYLLCVWSHHHLSGQCSGYSQRGGAALHTRRIK
jgi:hypothetical protein